MEKLIRDGIRPETGSLRYVDNVEYAGFLGDKLGEEILEFGEAILSGSREEMIEEAADLLEVLMTVFDFFGFSVEEVEKARFKKSLERGSFADGLVWNDE